MKQSFDNIEAIRPEYPWQTRVAFPEAFWTAEQMATGVLEAEFRALVSSKTAICRVGTDDGGIVRESPRTLLLKLSAEMTTGILVRVEGTVVFDFARIADGVRRAIPGLWTWPVKRTVTR